MVSQMKSLFSSIVSADGVATVNQKPFKVPAFLFIQGFETKSLESVFLHRSYKLPFFNPRSW